MSAPYSMCHHYETAATWDEQTKKKIWKRWIWETDFNAKPIEQCWDMNEMHICGILCMIRESLVPCEEFFKTTVQIIENQGEEEEDSSRVDVLHLHPTKSVCDYSIREVMDQLECFQLHWGKVMSAISYETSFQMLKALMARLGMIAQNACRAEGAVLDDPQHITALPKISAATLLASSNENAEETCKMLAVVSRKTLRQATCIFAVLFRIHFIVSNAQNAHETVNKLEDDEEEKKKIYSSILRSMKVHHIEASIDFFNHFQQMVYLAPAMRLVYRTNFAGMYNDVSQVIYFHFPRFARQPQIPLDEIPSSSLHMLPLINQIMPDVLVFYEDDSIIPGITSNISSADCEKYRDLKWAWLVTCSEIFLLEIQSTEDPSQTLIYISASKSLAELVFIILKKTGRKVGDDAIDVEGVDVVIKQGISLTAHGHVQIID